MRGKDMRLGTGFSTQRITPAYAGKSLPKDGTAKKAEDHPRLCGEKVTVAVPLIPYSGSPPPMRGKGHSPFRKHAA